MKDAAAQDAANDLQLALGVGSRYQQLLNEGDTAAAALALLAGAYLLRRAETENAISLDPPDPNFTVVQEPVDATVMMISPGGTVTSDEAAAANTLFATQAHEIGLEQAIVTAFNRAQGAAQAGDNTDQSAQFQAAQSFESQLSTTLAMEPAELTTLQQALQNDGFPTTTRAASDIANFQSQIAQQGLPSGLTQALQQLGSDSASLANDASMLVAQDPNAVASLGDFTTALTNPTLLAGLQSLSQTLQPPAAGIGAYDSATGNWYLRNEKTGGAPDAGQFAYGLPGWEGVTGDWDGNGTTTVGVVNPSGSVNGLPTPDAFWYLRNENSAGGPDATGGQPFAFGLANWIPLTGDWTGSGYTGIGMFDPSTNTFYLENTPGSGKVDFQFQYGAPGWLPVTGDWTGSGHSGIGMVDPTTMTWYLRTELSAGAPDAGQFAYGAPGWLPVTGNWNGGTTTDVGLFDPTHVTWYLRNEDNAGAPDAGQFAYGFFSWVPVGGAWSGGATNIGATPMRSPTMTTPATLDNALLLETLTHHKNQDNTSLADQVFSSGL